MKKLLSCKLLLGCLSSAFAADWYYDSDGCTKVYNYGVDSSECFDKKRELLQGYGCQAINKLSFGRYICIGR